MYAKPRPRHHPEPPRTGCRHIDTNCGAGLSHSIRQSPCGIISWFHSEEEVVIALAGFDKKAIGDVFYASAVAATTASTSSHNDLTWPMKSSR